MDISPGLAKKDATVTVPDREGSGRNGRETRQENARFRVSRPKVAAACLPVLVSSESVYTHVAVSGPTTYQRS